MTNPKKMTERAIRLHIVLFNSMIMLVFAVSGCAGKNDLSPIDVENQAFEDFRTEIRNAIDDPERETKAIAIADGLREELASLRGKKEKRQNEFKTLNANYDTTRAEFDAVIKTTNDEIRMNQKRIFQKRDDFIAITTPEEWIQISEARTEAISAAFATLQST